MNWPIELLHPSQLRVRVSDEFIGELEEHLRMLYSTDVSALPLIDKFGRCFVNGKHFPLSTIQQTEDQSSNPCLH